MNPQGKLGPQTAAVHIDSRSPLTVPGGDVAGAEVVRELPAEFALAAWQVLRSVLLWAGEPPQARGGLFEAETMEAWEAELLTGQWDAELRCPLAVVVGELAHPARAESERVAWGCVCVAEWALAHGANATALTFAEAAALAWPEHPRYAWMAGRLLRAQGKLREAELWLRRAERLAVTARDWEAQTRALMALGNLHGENGNYPDARHLHAQALRLARRHKLREIEAMAVHELFLLATATEDFHQADVYAPRAVEAYGVDHPHLPYLAHDIAYYWMSRGYFGRALTVFTALRDAFEHPELQLQLSANAARAAAACGEHALFDRLRSEAESKIPLLDDRSTLSSALIELALGASSVKEWDRALEALETAMEVARGRGQMNTLHRAEKVLEAVRSQQFAEARRHHPATVAQANSPADSLARSLVDSLQLSQYAGAATEFLPGADYVPALS